MPLTVQGREDFHDDFITDYAAAQPDKSVAKGTDVWAFARAVSATAWSIVSRLIYFDRNRLPDKADLANLQRDAAAYNFPQRGASTSSGTLALQVSGTPGAAVPVNSVLTHSDGTSYKVASVGAVVGGGGTVLVDVVSISTGLAVNKVIGETLTFSAPPLNVTAAAVLVGNLSGGVDVETLEQWRARFLAHLGDEPQGGKILDYVEWALTIAGPTTAYVWRHRRGTGTIDVAVLGSGTGTARVIADLTPFTALIESKRPGNVKDWRMLTTAPVAQNVTSAITIDTTIYKWDWDDLGVGYVITAHSSGASTLTVPTAPAGLIAGMRIQVNGEEARVTSRVGNVLTLSFSAPPVSLANPIPVAPTWFAAAVIDGVTTIRCSGDLVVPARTAILDLFAALGPARTTYAGYTWEDSIKYSKMYAAITDVAGVTDALLTVPAANISPSDDPLAAPSSIPFLVPGIVQVLKQ